MVEGGFQEQSEAVKKYERARLTSTQLSTYFVGSIAMWDLEEERRRRLAAASATPAGRRPSRRRAWSAASARRPASTTASTSRRCSAHGTPPLPALRRILLGE